ncbi:MAG: hypothetical protein J6Y07_01640 [Alphaproteobacteria bacterium]|nr:hypothetical protein [Alphaproteobacteria bacterium]
MGNFIKTQESFADGEVSINFFENDNIHGVAHMENFDVCAGGGLVRRPGLKKSAQLIMDARLVSFSASETEEYVLAIMNGRIRIFANDSFVQDVTTPWASSDIPKLQYAQRFGTMIFVHQDYPPKILYRENGVFKIRNFSFSKSSDGNTEIPFMRFEDSENITVTITNSGGTIHFTTNEDFWTPENVGGHLRAIGKTWLINSYISATDITATCNGAYTLPDDPVSDWQEAVFSPRRGWPSAITFHQDRLVFGGAKSWPGGIWLSQVGRHGNFDLGTGLDDEAIFFTLLSDRRQQVCTLVSSDNLQILTSEGEWAVSNKPLTPESVNIKMHTSIGSIADKYLPPQQMEGKTVFVAKNKRDIRQLSLDDLSEKYNADNLCALTSHLMKNPVDISYNKDAQKLFVVMSDGNMAVLNYNAALGISAWGRYTTDGKFTSVVTCDGKTFVVVKRGDNFFLERFDDSEFVDSTNYAYAATVSGLPLLTSGHNAKNIRIKKITVRVYNTKTLFINDSRVVLPNEIYDDTQAGFCGDASINILGTSVDLVDTPWKISTTDSLPLKILSVTIYGRYQI